MQKMLFTLIARASCLVFLAMSVAGADLPANGSGTAHSGYKAVGSLTPSGDGRMNWTGSYWGFSFNDNGDGFLHQVAWHCPAITDIHDSTLSTKGSCILTDNDGDRMYTDWTGGGPVDGEFAGKVALSGGTGKYEGIAGGWEFQCFGVGDDEQLHCKQQYDYELR